MSRKYTSALTDLTHGVAKTVGGTDWQETNDLTEFTLPDIEPNAIEVSGRSGLFGTIEIPDWANPGAIELTLKFATTPENISLLKASTQTHKLVWVEQYVSNDGIVSYANHAVIFTGYLKKKSGFTGKKGELPEREFPYSVLSYLETRNYGTGTDSLETIVNYDPLNKKFVIGGEDYSEIFENAVAAL